MLVESVDKGENTRAQSSNPYTRPNNPYEPPWDDIFHVWGEPRYQPPPKQRCYKCGKEIEVPRFSLPIGPRYCEECKTKVDAENKQKYHESDWATNKQKEEEANRRKYDPFYVRYDDGTSGPFNTQTKPVKEKRTLKCTKCQRELETIFTGIPQVFVCNTCQWNEYQSKEGK